jgi:hypothetical protein
MMGRLMINVKAPAKIPKKKVMMTVFTWKKNSGKFVSSTGCKKNRIVNAMATPRVPNINPLVTSGFHLLAFKFNLVMVDYYIVLEI